MNKNTLKNKKKRANKKLALASSAVMLNPISGKGDYQSMLRDIGAIVRPIVKTALTSAGSGFGGYLGSKVGATQGGATLGHALAARLSKLIGTGDYMVNDCSSNSLMKGNSGSAYAQFSNSSKSVRVQHREYLQDIFTGASAGTFAIEGYAINPGLSFSFPYLSSIAQNFEEYKIRGIVFEFVSTTSPFNSTSAMGSIVMAMQYNSAGAIFTSKPQMENSDFAISARFDKNVIYGVECDVNVQNRYYVRNSTSTLPLTTTDLGVLYVATQPSASFPANANVGELWVSYDVEFYRPKISPARFGYAHITNRGAAGVAPFLVTGTYPGLSGLVPLGSLTGAFINSTPSLVFPNADVGDTYLITYIMVATLTVSGGPSISYVGFTPTNLFNGYLADGAVATNSSGLLVGVLVLTVIAENPTLTIGSVTVTGTFASDIIITDVGNGLIPLL